MIYLKYLKSLLLHKWYVFLAGLKTGVPVWRLIVHDLSKFTPAEFIPYARNFFGKGNLDKVFDKKKLDKIQSDFDRGWLFHQNRNPHHWQFWILVYDDDPKVMKAVSMPETYVREMVADWMGANRAYTGSWNMAQWLSDNGPRMEKKMHDETIRLTHKVLIEQGYMFTDNAPWICLWNQAEAFNV